MYAKGLAVTQPSPTSRVGEHRSLVLEKVQAFTGNDVTSRIGNKHAAKQCNTIFYLTECDDRAELRLPLTGLGW